MCKSDADIVSAGCQSLSLLFDRFQDELSDCLVDTIDIVNSILGAHTDDLTVAALCFSFLENNAVEDMHMIILSSSDKGFGLYCDFLLKYLVSNACELSTKSMLTVAVYYGRSPPFFRLQSLFLYF
jgi:hypothetical protein